MKHIDLHTLLQNTILTSEPLINPYLQAPPKGCLEDRVAIYANGFYARLEEALASDYSTLAALIGEDEFGALCRNYIDVYPSFSYSLNNFGQNLCQFLTATAPYNKKPYLAEIAAFEWAEYQAIVAHDALLLAVAKLQAKPVTEWFVMKFYLHPSCTMLPMHWNSLALIQAVRSKQVIPAAKKLKESQWVLVWRRQLEVLYRNLHDLEFTMLHAITKDATFMEICELLSQKMPETEVANYLASELYAWLEEQLFVDLSP